jgi:hypothetical protein
VGVCREKIDYGAAVNVPRDIAKLRADDDLITVAQGELAETVLRRMTDFLEKKSKAQKKES